MAGLNYNIYISDVVIEEAKAGDNIASEKRLNELKTFPILKSTEKAEELAKIYIEKLSIPLNAIRDAAHLSIASIHKID